MRMSQLPAVMVRRTIYTAQALRTQWKSPEEIEKMQVKHLKYIVDHAYRNTVLYHQKFKKAGVHPQDIQSLSDLKKIPFTTKNEMRNVEESMARGYPRETCHTRTTSGSSGMKLKIYYNLSAQDRNKASTLRYLIAAGMKPWYTYAVISHLEDDTPGFRPFQFSYTVPIPGHLDESTKVELLTKIRPHVMGGHPCTMLLLAKRFEKEGLNFHPKFIFVGGELSTREERQYIEKVFGCETFNKYGAFEFRTLGWECNHHNMHMDADSNIIEFLKDGEPVAPGERGEVVGTNLWNRAMPFIRYRLGDIAAPSEEMCSCGRGLPLFSLIEGRRDSFIVAGNRFIPPTKIVPLFFPLHEIDAFQVIQEDLKTLKVNIVKGDGFSDQILKKINENLRNVVGDMEIEIITCETLVEEEQAKLRAVISKVEKNLLEHY